MTDTSYQYVMTRGAHYAYGRYPNHPIFTGVDNMTVTGGGGVDDLEEVNVYVNETFGRSTDQFDRWVFMSEQGIDSGDCEDFVLTKADLLLRLGWPVARLQMEFGFQPTDEYAETGRVLGHMWLVATVGSTEFCLDNNHNQLRTRADMKTEWPILGCIQISGREWAWVNEAGDISSYTVPPWRFTITPIPFTDFEYEALTISGKLGLKA